MTITEFAASQSFIRWLENRSRPYEIYHTPRFAYAVPRVSTRPVVYGVLGFDDDKDQVLELIRSIVAEEDIYPLKDFGFDESQIKQSDE